MPDRLVQGKCGSPKLGDALKKNKRYLAMDSI